MARRGIITVAMVGTFGVAAIMPAQAAGFLDDLARAFFGGGRPTPPVYVDSPFEMTVQPKRRAPRVAAPSRPIEPAVKLDPASDPYWYLSDPTLRKGDIVVTRSGVVVFDGREASRHSPSAFTALGEAKRLPKSQQQTLQAAAAGGRAYFGTAVVPATVATTPPAATGTTVSQLR